jgi:hypothetical protein
MKKENADGKAPNLAEMIGDGPGQFKISFYKQGIDQHGKLVGTEHFMDEIATQKDLDEQNRIYQMHLEDQRNPKYDDTELKKISLDNMMRDPSFAHLRDELETMKAGLVSKAEMKKIEKKLEDEVDRGELGPELEEYDAQMTMMLHEWAQDMIEDPEYAEVRNNALEFQRMLPDWAKEEATFLAVRDRLNAKLAKLPVHQRKIAENKAEEQRTGKRLLDGKPLDAPMPWEVDETDDKVELDKEDLDMDNYMESLEDQEALDKLLMQMKDLMKAMGGDKKIESEIQQILDDDPTKPDPNNPEGLPGVDMETFAEQLEELKNAPPEGTEDVEDGQEKVDPKLEAIVDKIMEDPNLLEKLAAVKELIASRQGDPTARQQPSAPEPETWDKSDMVTYKQRLQMAERDPEHLAAMRRLQINLLPPFNISPAVKHLNQALKLAYLGPSDDVRRILWRTYNKARTMPTLLQNIPDDAWDMLWYSQAVTWASNQNRQNHLKILLQDLNTVGKDGPPTDPDTLAAQ